MKIVVLWTDATVWALLACAIAYGVMVLRNPGLRANWRKVFRDAPAAARGGSAGCRRP